MHTPPPMSHPQPFSRTPLGGANTHSHFHQTCCTPPPNTLQPPLAARTHTQPVPPTWHTPGTPIHTHTRGVGATSLPPLHPTPRPWHPTLGTPAPSPSHPSEPKPFSVTHAPSSVHTHSRPPALSPGSHAHTLTPTPLGASPTSSRGPRRLRAPGVPDALSPPCHHHPHRVPAAPTPCPLCAHHRAIAVPTAVPLPCPLGAPHGVPTVATAVPPLCPPGVLEVWPPRRSPQNALVAPQGEGRG